MTDVCKDCSGTGKRPDVVAAYDRIVTAASESEERWGNVIAEDGVAWADVLAVAREWRRLAPLDRTPAESLESK